MQSPFVGKWVLIWKLLWIGFYVVPKTLLLPLLCKKYASSNTQARTSILVRTGSKHTIIFFNVFVQTVLQRQAEKKADEQRRRRERKRKKGGGPAEVLLREILKKQNKLTNLWISITILSLKWRLKWCLLSPEGSFASVSKFCTLKHEWLRLTLRQTS